MGNKSTTVLMLGTPTSGKTTYLAAFWHAIRQPSESSELQLEQLPVARAYLNEICRAWQNGEEVGRTQLGSGERIELDLRLGELRTALAVPDLSGETFSRHFKLRVWDTDHADLVTETTGVLLFLHPEHLGLPVSISDVSGDDVVQKTPGPAKVGAKGSAVASGVAGLDQVVQKWKPEDAPSSVILTDELQHVTGTPGMRAGLHVAVVISAWDLVPEGATPSGWLARNAPLLDQFLRRSTDIGEVAVFGVSAQGGDIDDRTQREALLGRASPLDRTRVVGPGEGSIVSPVAWLIQRC